MARYFQSYKANQLRRAYIFLEPKHVKGVWTLEEDLKALIGYRIFQNDWWRIRQLTGLQRKNNQIRERVENKLSRKLKTGMWDDIKEDP